MHTLQTTPLEVIGKGYPYHINFSSETCLVISVTIFFWLHF